MDLTPAQQSWLEHVDSSEAFAGTVADYVREHELDIGKLYFYLSAIQAKRSQSSAAFVTVTRAMPVQNERPHPATEWRSVTVVRSVGAGSPRSLGRPMDHLPL